MLQSLKVIISHLKSSTVYIYIFCPYDDFIALPVFEKRHLSQDKVLQREESNTAQNFYLCEQKNLKMLLNIHVNLALNSIFTSNRWFW